MPRIAVEDVQGWVEPTKLNVSSLDTALLNQIETEVLSLLGTVFDTSTWLSESTTPNLVKVVIAKLYAGWLYDRTYSENQAERNEYAAMLKENAGMLMTGLLDGTVEIPGVIPTTSQGASFYPNDASSAQEPTVDDLSLGPARFSLGRVF